MRLLLSTLMLARTGRFVEPPPPVPAECGWSNVTALRAWAAAGQRDGQAALSISIRQREFFRFNIGGLALSYGGRCLVYVRVWKAANNLIRESEPCRAPITNVL